MKCTPSGTLKGTLFTFEANLPPGETYLSRSMTCTWWGWSRATDSMRALISALRAGLFAGSGEPFGSGGESVCGTVRKTTGRPPTPTTSTRRSICERTTAS